MQGGQGCAPRRSTHRACCSPDSGTGSGSFLGVALLRRQSECGVSKQRGWLGQGSGKQNTSNGGASKCTVNCKTQWRHRSGRQRGRERTVLAVPWARRAGVNRRGRFPAGCDQSRSREELRRLAVLPSGRCGRRTPRSDRAQRSRRAETKQRGRRALLDLASQALDIQRGLGRAHIRD